MSRLIPILTIQEKKLIKTKQFKPYKYLGDPLNAVEIFGRLEVDELIVIDVSQSELNENRRKLIRRLSERATMPITFGGGITNLTYARLLFSYGYDKIIIKQGLNDKKLINSLIMEYGSASVTAGLDIAIIDEDNCEINKIKMKNDDVLLYVLELENSGIGQILFNFYKNDGMRNGISITEVITSLANQLSVPIVVCGGCRNKQEASDIVTRHPNIAIGASTIFTLLEPNDAVLIRY